MTRKRSSPADAIIDLASRLPWWAGVALAGISFVLFSALAPVVAVRPGNASPAAALIAGVVIAARVALPILFLAGAAMSAWSRYRRGQLFEAGSGEQGATAIRGMTWREFEALLGEAFRRRGYSVSETGGGGADGGIDLVLRKDGATELVQCKHWEASSVGVKVVRELFGVVGHHHAAAGWVVTSGRFTDEAREFAKGKRLTLVDGRALGRLLRDARAPGASDPAPDDRGSPAAPACPSCGKVMVRRVARKGSREGESFWGCTGYPACRGTRSIG